MSDLVGKELAFPLECATCGMPLWTSGNSPGDTKLLRYSPDASKAYCAFHTPADARFVAVRHEAKGWGGRDTDEWAKIVEVGPVVYDE